MKSKVFKLRSIKLLMISILIMGIIGFLSIIIINYHVKSSVKQKIISTQEASKMDKSDCILVLGAMVWNNSRPSHMLEDRLKQGIELYEIGASDRIIMSGDHGQKGYDEVNVMKKYATDRGIPSYHVFMDHAGFSTYESLYRAMDIFQAKKIIIVTQEYHLYRALYIANKMGLEAYGVASNPREYAGQEARDVREVLARVKDFFYVLIKPKPTYLGEVIPISGDGDVTND